MPKIPSYVSDVGVPLVDQPRISGSTLAAPYEALRQGAQGVESGASLAYGHTLAIEDEQRRQSQLSESAKNVNGATKALIDAENALKIGARDPETGEVVEPPASAKDFLPRWRDKHKQIGQDYLKQITDPIVRDRFVRGWERATESSYREAASYQRGLFVKEDTANVEQGLSDYLRLAQQASTPEDAKYQIDQGNALLDGKHMILGATETFRQRKNFNDEWTMHQANREIDQTGTYDREQYATRLDPARLDALDRRAESVARRAEAESNRRDAAIIAARDDRKIEIGTLITQRKLSDAQQKLDFYAQNRLLQASEIEHLQDEIAKGPRAAASDRAVAQRIGLDVHSVNPRTKQDEIDSLVQSGALSLDDGTKYKERLRATLQANQDKTKSENLNRHGQAEQNLRAMLNWHPDMIGALEAKIEGDLRPWLYDKGLKELTERSNAYRGAEDPIAVVESLRPEFNKVMKDAKPSPELMMKMFPDEQSLEKARQRGWISQDDANEVLPRIRQQRLAPVPTLTPQTAPKAQRVR